MMTDAEIRRRFLAKIHIIAKNDLGLSDDEYRDTIERWTGQRTCKHFDNDILRRVANSLAEMAKHKRRSPENFGTATEKQWRHVRYLQKRLGWTDANLRGFVRHVCHIDHERFLTAKLARELISGLKNMERYHAVSD
jgi:phage gp16-like protein